MNKRGFVLVFGLLVVTVLVVLSSSVYFKSLNENSLSRRYAESMRAFWLAEAGVAMAGDALPDDLRTSGTIGGASYSTNAAQVTSSLYTITSTGTVELSPGKSLTRTIIASLKSNDVQTGSFQYGIETTADLIIKGAVEIYPSDSKKEGSTLDFANLFGFSKADLQAHADHVYTPSTFPDTISGLTWVNVPTGKTLTISGDGSGSGILIINGDVKFSGTYDFNGIIYVIGKLTMHGTVETHGAVLAESGTKLDTTLTGTVDIYYDQGQIEAALNEVRFVTKDIVSWKEESTGS